jgi:hypothetical protein
MPTNLAIVHTGDFIRARPDGVLDLDASRKLLAEVMREGVCRLRTRGLMADHA